MEEEGEGGQRNGGGTTTATEGEGGQERVDKSGRNTLTRGVSCRKKRPRTEKRYTEAYSVGGQAGQSQSQYKKGHITNIYLTNSDSEAIVDFVKDHKELYDKTNEHVKDKARKVCLCEQFTPNHKLSVKVCKTCFDSKGTHYGKLTQSKSGPEGDDGMSELDTGQV